LRIFVQIASYRDPELFNTVVSCLKNAKRPELLTFGICDQYCESDNFKDIAEFEEDFRFKIDKVPYTESRGCCWARNRVQSFYGGEEYTLQIDAHSRFAKNWDNMLIDMLSRCPSRKPIISSYPAWYSPETEKRTSDIWEMVPSFSGKKVIPRFVPAVQKKSTLREHGFFAAGFAFTVGEFCKEIPYDPEIYFQGEEISIAVRAWTKGYNLYIPDKIAVWHQYERESAIRHWADHTTENGFDLPFSKLNALSEKKVSDLLLGKPINEPYGIGSERTIESYENATGIWFEKSFVDTKARESNCFPVHKTSAWKIEKKFLYKTTLNLKPILPQLLKENPDKLAIFIEGSRRDIDCSKEIPAKVEFELVLRSPPQTFTAWAYKKNPLKWGTRFVRNNIDYVETEL
jgi:hypothetical protein